LFVLALSGFRPGLPATVGATSSPARPDVSAAATPRVTLRPDPTLTPSEPPPTPAPTATPASTAGPAPTFQTYVVRSGDTLGGIANRFGTTVRAIADLNGISDPTRLQIGQRLLIP
jgi:LysM repeat protein